MYQFHAIPDYVYVYNIRMDMYLYTITAADDSSWDPIFARETIFIPKIARQTSN